jgi:hypothetical protein
MDLRWSGQKALSKSHDCEEQNPHRLGCRVDAMVREYRCRATSRFVLGIRSLFENLSSRSLSVMAPCRGASACLYTMCLNLSRFQRVIVGGRESERAMVTGFDSADAM